MARLANRVAFAFLVTFGMVMTMPTTASAHAEFVSSTPADQATVEGPLTDVTLVFVGTPTAVDGGIAAADAAGRQFLPASIVQDGLVVVATFDPPLESGTYALAWRVRSDDTHFINGNLSFTVNAAVAVTSPPPATAAASAVPPTSAAPDVVAVDVAEPADTSTAAPVAPVLDGGDGEGEGVMRIGRLLLFPSAVVVIGILGFAAFAFTGRRDDLGVLVRTVRWLGVGVAFGALIEVVGLTSLLGGFSEVVATGPGRAAIARVIGGVLITLGFVAINGTARPLLSTQVESSARPRTTRSLSAAVVDDKAPPVDRSASDEESRRWRPTSVDLVGLAGVAIVVASFAFDGHTVGQGPRVLHSAASLVHVAGAGVWAGGLVALAVVLSRRFRDGVTPRALEMIVPFSVFAMAALVVTGLAGVAMALFVDTDVFGYLSTEWGRYLLIKVALVAAAGAIGAYNHFRVMPDLRAAPDDPTVVARARSTITGEALLVVAAAFVTALLVAASTIS